MLQNTTIIDSHDPVECAEAVHTWWIHYAQREDKQRWLPISAEMVRDAKEQDLRYSNYLYERAWDLLEDMLATVSRRLPDGWAIDYARDGKPRECPITLGDRRYWEVR